MTFNSDSLFLILIFSSGVQTHDGHWQYTSCQTLSKDAIRGALEIIGKNQVSYEFVLQKSELSPTEFPWKSEGAMITYHHGWRTIVEFTSVQAFKTIYPGSRQCYAMFSHRSYLDLIPSITPIFRISVPKGIVGRYLVTIRKGHFLTHLSDLTRISQRTCYN